MCAVLYADGWRSAPCDGDDIGFVCERRRRAS
jgi:hypothetical protein